MRLFHSQRRRDSMHVAIASSDGRFFFPVSGLINHRNFELNERSLIEI